MKRRQAKVYRKYYKKDSFRLIISAWINAVFQFDYGNRVIELIT
ncbi:hypothetical protein [Peribacillus butanolivorans]